MVNVSNANNTSKTANHALKRLALHALTSFSSKMGLAFLVRNLLDAKIATKMDV